MGIMAMVPALLFGCTKDDPGERVAGGVSISNLDWELKRDFVVYVTEGAYCCTGTVAGDVVLTAKHCVEGKPASILKVKTAYGEIGVDRKEENPSMDVALLFLKADAGTKNTLYLSSRKPVKGDSVAITGFGTTESKGCGSLHGSGQGQIQIVDCGYQPSHVACASSGPYSITASCGGDSGGPWWRASAGAFHVVGVNSFGYSGRCGDSSKHTGFVHTSAIEPWVKSKTNKFTFRSEL